METNDSILVAGASGLVGSAIIRGLIQKRCTNIVGTFSARQPEPELLLPDSYHIVSSNTDVLHFASHDSRLTPHELRLHRVDLRNQDQTHNLFQRIGPEYVFLAAAKVGGIMANTTRRAEFIHDNLMITANVIHQSWLAGVRKLLNLGSTCIYPRDCPQPMQEEHLLTAPLEYTNEPYAVAKIAGLKMCESYNLQYGTNFLSAMPTNLYGPGDNFDLETAHVLPALVRRMHLAKCLGQGGLDSIREDLHARPVDGIDGNASDKAILEVLQQHGISGLPSPNASRFTPHALRLTPHASRPSVSIWGTGSPLREFLYSDDMADACLFVMDNIDFSDLAQGKQEVRNTQMNIGSTEEISIRDLACKVRQTVGFQGQLEFDPSKPDGTPRKLTDSSKLHSLGWKHKTTLDQGLEKLYSWYLQDLRRKE